MGKTLHHYDDDFEFMMAVHEAWTKVLAVTGDRSTLVYSDEALALKAAAQMGTTNPLDVLGYRPFEYRSMEFASVYLEMEKDEFFGGETSRTYQKQLPIDSTLFTILKAVDEGLGVTGNYHHTLLEGFQVKKAEHAFDGDILVITPVLGS